MEELAAWLAVTGTSLANEPKRKGEMWTVLARNVNFEGTLTASADDYSVAVRTLMQLVDARIARLSREARGIDTNH